VAKSGHLCIQDLADTDGIQDGSVSRNTFVQSQLAEDNHNISVHEDICHTQDHINKEQNTNGGFLEYDWDSGPLELFPWDLLETVYAPDKGPYSPAAFSPEESEPMLG
jgi:hypothetical protein